MKEQEQNHAVARLPGPLVNPVQGSLSLSLFLALEPRARTAVPGPITGANYCVLYCLLCTYLRYLLVRPLSDAAFNGLFFFQ